jgi:hypothetical protein
MDMDCSFQDNEKDWREKENLEGPAFKLNV